MPYRRITFKDDDEEIEMIKSQLEVDGDAHSGSLCSVEDEEEVDGDSHSGSLCSVKDEEVVDRHSESDLDPVVEAIKKRKEETNQFPCMLEPDDMVSCICFHPFALEVAVACTHVMKVYYYQDEFFTEKYNYKLVKPLDTLVFSDNGDQLIGTSSKSLLTFQHVGEEKMVTFPKFFRRTIITLECGADCIIAGDDDGVVHAVKLYSMNLEFSLKVSSCHINSVSINNNIAYATSENNVYGINVMEAAVIYQCTHSDDLMCGIVHGSSLVCGSSAGELVLFDITKRKLQFQGTYHIAKRSTILSVVSVSDELIAVSLDNGTVKLFSLFPHREIGIIGQLNTFATDLAVSHDGDWLIATEKCQGCQLFSVGTIETASPKRKKLKNGFAHTHLNSSDIENKCDFFGSL